MQDRTERIIPRFFWADLDAALDELKTLLGSRVSLDSLLLKQIDIKLQFYCEGVARKGVDFKIIRRHPGHSLFELRWDIQTGSGLEKLRLIGSHPNPDQLVLLCWHIKNSREDLETQRRRQNLAIEIAVRRLEKFNW